MKTQVRFKDKLRGENSAGRKRLRQVKYKDVPGKQQIIQQVRGKQAVCRNLKRATKITN